MDASISSSENLFLENEIGIVFRYSRANIYSYHALIGSLEIHPDLSNIPIFTPSPDIFLKEINRLFSVENFERLVLGLSVNTFQLEDNIKLLKKLNSHSKRNRLLIIAGGPHPSAKPDELLNNGVDVVVIGEGEKTFPELISTYAAGNSFEIVNGIAFKEDGKIITCPKNEGILLDDYPPFAPDHELYSAIEITRGCNYGCTYCQTPMLFGKSVRYRSPQNVIRWGKFLLSKRENWDFRFISPNAFGYGSKRSSKPNLEMIEQLLSGLKSLEAKKRKRIFFGTFPSEVRPESITEGTLELTKKYCDNDNITLGAQSGSPAILKTTRRGHTVNQVIEAVDLAKSYGFQMNIDFILGYPEETEEDQYMTLELCRELIAKGCKIHMHYLIPLPGTAYENAIPSLIAPEILSVIRKWSNEGIIFGSWQHQYDAITRK